MESVFKIENVNLFYGNKQALKNIMLIYLPWFPLGEQTNFELDLNFQEENEIVNKQNSIVILITTKNYGNIKVVLSRIKNSTISILISCICILCVILTQNLQYFLKF